MESALNELKAKAAAYVNGQDTIAAPSEHKLPAAQIDGAHAANGTNGHAKGSAHGTNGKTNGHTVATAHPLDQLSTDELTSIGDKVREHLMQSLGIKAYRFISNTLVDPPKKDVLKYLGIATNPEELGKVEPDQAVKLARRAKVIILDALTGSAYTILVTIDRANVTIDKVDKLAKGVQPSICPEELLACEDIIKADPQVCKLARELGLEPEQLAADGWSIGMDDRFGSGRRIQQALMYARLQPDDNLYAHPLDFVPVVDVIAGKVIHIDFPATKKPGEKLSRGSSAPHDINADQLAESGRERVPVPRQPYEYLPDLLAEHDPTFKLRTDLKLLHITQPEGASFTLDGHHLKWSTWDLHVGFNAREGLYLNMIQYDDHGVKRPIIARLSNSELVVPYASEAFPHSRKFALDIGEYLIGTLTNSLELGCDCLGEIAYLDGLLTSHDGSAMKIKNAICIHEEDGGVLWKHTDYRQDGKTHAVRSRKLVISSFATVANYEYGFFYEFHLDGTIKVEVKLTGILNTWSLAEGEDAGLTGTQVAPRVVGQHHQHLFSLRIEPMLDGVNNTVVETNVVSAEGEVGSAENYAGNRFEARKTVLKTAKAAIRDPDPATSRYWSIVQPSEKHYSSGHSPAYKIMAPYQPPLYCKPGSWVARRAPFAKHGLWVVPTSTTAATSIYPAGEHVPQSCQDGGELEDSVQVWADRDENIENTDIALYLTFGTTHIPRPEDFPVMPTEHLSVTLKPVGFFKQNPALDVPAVRDSKSKLAHCNGC
ncbi:uncharacterized protein L969DRAFT_88243 [Mixia osmundae IAM 14324]|uniref:Amine oxidase n=1 Tax=Mixia osmundae (strain CBS 9802 / IAM 14324 / JCM 22182 / KY 12970) TaxID=764103 RepID=G7E8J0_MIXOS|nr:uncharacterized protein L969DRAFT_88243 [Mixia osmundae IAM 14324]KEI38890.1 hypothetical protein L969DRAFT_88243 [Mixia osmundae IAM 14324]GAA99150.1 hypothetical protein E5Q_05841 [Mixia osmundae IAM 14324]